MELRANRIKRLREVQGLKIGELADKADVSIDYIYRLERGERTQPSAIHLAGLARALKTSTDYLVGLTDDPRLLPAALDSPISPDLIEIAYRVQRLSHPMRERLLDSINSLLDMCDAVTEEMAKVKIIGGEVEAEEEAGAEGETNEAKH